MTATILLATPGCTPSRLASPTHTRRDQDGTDLQNTGVAANYPIREGVQTMPDLPSARAALADLSLAAAALYDIEKVRIATQNRLRAMRDDHGLEGVPPYQGAEATLDALKAAEHHAELELKRALRRHPLGAWIKGTVGLGEKQGARLIAAIGDPYIRPEIKRPDGTVEPSRPRRGPAELWAYCGYHTLPADGQGSYETQRSTAVGGNIAARRRKGQRANWNADAKTRAFLCAQSCIKQAHSPYRAVYDRERAKWNGRDTSDGHKYNHALRVTAKEILKDLWCTARDLQLGGAVAERREATA